jgi:predicted  nucleic acid-binding Zn-ribbon protein
MSEPVPGGAAIAVAAGGGRFEALLPAIEAAVTALERERDEAREALGELRVAYQALLARFEESQRARDALAAQQTGLREELAETARQLDGLIRVLRR